MDTCDQRLWMITKKCQGCDIVARINQVEKIRQEGKEMKRRTPTTKLHFQNCFFQGEKKTKTKPCLFFPQKMHFLNYETKEFLSFFLSDFVWLSQCNGGTYWSKIFMKITLCKGHFFSKLIQFTIFLHAGSSTRMTIPALRWQHDSW